MPSRLHESLLQLFRNRPRSAPELMRDALGLALPHYSEALAMLGQVLGAGVRRANRVAFGVRELALHT